MKEVEVVYLDNTTETIPYVVDAYTGNSAFNLVCESGMEIIIPIGNVKKICVEDQ
jgi:hypothetical protein